MMLYLKIRWGYFLVFIALAVILATLSTWPIDSLTQFVRFLLHFSLLVAIFLLFVDILPKRTSLPTQILVALFCGALMGKSFALMGSREMVTDYLGILGTLFILLLRLVVMPLIFVSVVCGVAGMNDFKRLGKIGTKAFAYYLLTTCVAVLIGLTLVNLIDPGFRFGDSFLGSQTEKETNTASYGAIFQQKTLPAFLQSPFFPGQNPISVIVFAMLLGSALASLGASGQVALSVFQSLDSALVRIIHWIMLLAPIGVFSLISRVFAQEGFMYVFALSKFFTTVIIGLAIHFFILVFVLVPRLGKMPGKQFLEGVFPALEMAFSTSSSNATLPTSLNCTIERLGADPNISHFMLPVGATVNMDGTALYVAVASVFIAQVYNIPLELKQQVTIFITAILVSIGTAGIPGASIGLLGVIFQTVGIPMEGIGLILGVDRFLDMCRTVINVTGDCAGTIIVSRSETRVS